MVRPTAVANLLGDLWLVREGPNVAAALASPGVALRRVAEAQRLLGALEASGLSG